MQADMTDVAQRSRSPIGRSLDVYYRDAARNARMDALNAQFVPAGGLAFDIGAHVGDRTGSFLRLGAWVVAAEPQPKIFRALRLLHGRNANVALMQAAVGAAKGELEMHINSANPTISTASCDLISAAQGAKEWAGQVWDDKITVPVTTLDTLIATHGTPDFIKIDVEGYEREVLNGLTQPVRALSFEFTTIQRDVAFACLDALKELASYRFNFSLGEEHSLRLPEHVSAPDLVRCLYALPASANSGDIFAVLN